MSSPTGRSFEDLLRDPHEQFDARGELLASVTEYAAAKPAAASGPPAGVDLTGLPAEQALALGAAREQMRAKNPIRGSQVPPHITKDAALAELRWYQARFPTVPPEVTAIDLVRRVDQWDELNAILAALREVLRDGTTSGE